MVVSAADIPQHLRVTAESVLLLYSADFFDTWLGGLRFVALLQLAGLALAGLASGVDRVGQYRWESKDSWYDPACTMRPFWSSTRRARGTPGAQPPAKPGHFRPAGKQLQSG
jgi:hypothetical protein